MSFPPPYPSPLPEAAPEALGFDPAALREAVEHALAHETPFPRDLLAHLEGGHFEPAPDNEVLGPVVPRGDPNGLVMRDGVVAVRWGDTLRADMTFSVAKSCLSILAGIAVKDGLIPDLDARVGASVADPAFEGPRNGAITWRMLLQQTSEWEGSLFGKKDQIDRGRDLASEGKKPKGWARPLGEPGSTWEYNDVRVNVLSLALLRTFGRALPEVWKERVADPIGSSPNWRWEGYRTSTVEVGGQEVVSVPGGGHWGGGIVTDAEDQARLGLLMLNDGVWEGIRLLPEGWVEQSGIPVSLHPDYGFLWWLNRSRRYPDADPASLFAVGAGGNVVWIEPSSRMVAVFRWLDPAALPGMVARLAAARGPAAA